MLIQEVGIALNIAFWLWIITIAYQITMLNSDGFENERKHLVKIILLFVVLIAVVIAHNRFGSL